MKKKIENLKDLFLEQGRELYDACKQEQKELRKIQNQVSDMGLKKVIDRQLDAVKDKNDRLKEVFKELNENPKGKKSKNYEAIIDDSNDLLKRSKDLRVRDAVIINSAQRLNQNNIVGLGVFSSYASEMGHKNIANTILESLDEEKDIEKELSVLAKEKVYKQVAATAH